MHEHGMCMESVMIYVRAKGKVGAVDGTLSLPSLTLTLTVMFRLEKDGDEANVYLHAIRKRRIGTVA